VKVHVRVGEVVVIVDGIDYTRRQVTALLAAAAMADQMRTPEVEERPVVALGFTTERLPDDLADEPGYEDDD
jgi:hypothetical protein